MPGAERPGAVRDGLGGESGAGQDGLAAVAGIEVDTRHWIGGQRVASAGSFTDISPIDEAPIAHVARGGADEAAAAVSAAAGAFPAWSSAAPADRAALLHAIADRWRPGLRTWRRSRRPITGR